MSLDGFNATIPYKKEIFPLLWEIDDEARLLSSVNTVKNLGGKLKGYNTDVFGFTKSLSRKGAKIGGNVAIIGLGGVGTMAATYCFFSCKSLTLAVLPRHLERAREFAKSLREKARERNLKGADIKISLTDELKGGFDLIVNCSPVGMFPKENACPVASSAFMDVKAVFDCIYNPKETIFLRLAKENGALAVGGTEMLAIQALEAEKIWLKGIVSQEKIQNIYEEVISFSEKLLK